MHETELKPDDPKLTAYALGELDGDERAAVEAAVRQRPDLRAVVDEIAALAAQLESALATETVEAAARGGAERGMAETAPARAGDEGWAKREMPGDAAAARRAAKLVRFPQLYYLVGGLAAAGVALLVMANREAYRAREWARTEQVRQAVSARTTVAVRGVAAPEVAATTRADAAAVEIPERSERPAFTAGGLALLEQVQRPTEGDAGIGARSAVEPEATAEKRAASAAVEPAATVAGGGAVRETAGGAAEVRFAAKSVDELAPGMARVFAPPVAGAGPMAAANGDVVTLPAFTVTAERAGFAATAPARRRGGPELWGEEREYRPPAPAGAKFGRTTGEVHDNGFVVAAVEPRSTFAADTEAGSYLEVRRAIARQELPAREAVKIEELLNHFPYRYAAPAGERTLTFFEKLRGEDGAPPFAAALEVAEAPWAPGHRLVRVGLKGRDLRPAERPAANLVFLIDVSHSMQEPNKLPLVKESLRQLVGRLRADDRVAIVTYAGKSGLVLPSTPVERAREILAAIDTLAPRDAGTGATGLRLAYDVARGRFAEDGINRVILCTDGDFSLGAAGETELLRLVEERAGSGVFLSVLGFGMGSYRDATLEQLAWRGNGSHGYIDSRREAQRLLVEQVSGSLATIAKDVRVQVAFDPARVAQYRLIGYENRLLRQEDFDRESPGGGEIAAGHAVTALYEVIPAAGADVAAGGELLTVTVRYKKPGGLFARKAEYRLQDAGRGFAAASADFRFAAAVAQFGMMLRQSPYRGRATLGDVIAWAAAAAANPADDPGGYRGEFVDLVRAAQERWRSE